MGGFKMFMYLWSSCAIFIGLVTAFTGTDIVMNFVGLGATIIGILGFSGAVMMED